MSVNHLGYEALVPNQFNGSLLENLVLIGSFAPVQEGLVDSQCRLDF